MYKKIILFLLLILSLSAFQIWTDKDRIADVQAITGQAVAIADGEKRILTRDSKLYVKEVLAVGEKSFLQVIFRDGTVLSMEENTEVELRQFAFDAWDDENNLVDFNMIAGGMRFLTGKVTKNNPEAFSFETPLGTIGIRGTEGTTDTELANDEQYSQSLNMSINASTTTWSHAVAPEVTRQTTQHVDGDVNRVMTFSDLFGKTVSMARGEEVVISSTTGTNDPRLITPIGREDTKPTRFKAFVSIPKDVRAHFPGFAGGGRYTPGTGGGDGALTPSSSNSSSSGGGGSVGSPTNGP
ncbi:MAG: FecR domain-containing protein [Proteobacteria bacterium]|nr:FecR domain-containing protein [Pseudomonadota bacterium]MBU1611067.1 FecR domain-containing protein [Pseudomonadota bacterium]